MKCYNINLELKDIRDRETKKSSLVLILKEDESAKEYVKTLYGPWYTISKLRIVERKNIQILISNKIVEDTMIKYMSSIFGGIK